MTEENKKKVKIDSKIYGNLSTNNIDDTSFMFYHEWWDNRLKYLNKRAIFFKEKYKNKENKDEV